MNAKEIRLKQAENKQLLETRLSEFEETYRKGDKEIFRELCFCILTASSSARAGIKAIEYLGDLIFKCSEKELSFALKKSGYRFWRKRANYIVETRKFMQKRCNMQLKKEIEKKMEDKKELRAFFADNAKGIGMKEASHFLRNIGFKDYAILDKHIINCLHEANVLKSNTPPKNRNNYLEMEDAMKAYSRKINVPMAELDLILWSSKTGIILK